MKWLRTLVLFDGQGFMGSSDWEALHSSYVRAIQSIEHPPSSGKLTLRRKRRGPDGDDLRNGVVPLKQAFRHAMQTIEHWQVEGAVVTGAASLDQSVKLYPSGEDHKEESGSDFGGYDFVISTAEGNKVAIEWETGNISSSHRSLNKLVIALTTGAIQGAVLVVPSRDLYAHLTDRIGNIDELSGYLSLWKAMGEQHKRGLLAITVVEHDELTDDPQIPYLPKGKDGRAKEAAEKLLQVRAKRK